MDYDLLKAIHVAADFIWLGGILLNGVVLAVAIGLPERLPTDLFAKIRRWDLSVSLPAMVVVWVFGLWIALDGGWYRDGWFMTKFVLVLLLSGLHGSQMAALRKLAAGQPTPERATMVKVSASAASILAVVVTFLAIMKPF